MVSAAASAGLFVVVIILVESSLREARCCWNLHCFMAIRSSRKERVCNCSHLVVSWSCLEVKALLKIDSLLLICCLRDKQLLSCSSISVLVNCVDVSWRMWFHFVWKCSCVIPTWGDNLIVRPSGVMFLFRYKDKKCLWSSEEISLAYSRWSCQTVLTCVGGMMGGSWDVGPGFNCISPLEMRNKSRTEWRWDSYSETF